MNVPRIGSLCTGYGGLDRAVSSVLGGETAWTSDIDKGACKIIAHRFPDVPNIGDMTTVDWSQLEPVDILTAGYPCQPFSHAGNRKGANDARHLWPYVREAIRVLRPRLALLENVAGHRSLGFDRVLGDLAEDGMYVRWTSIRASDIGAPHQRERLFIVVTADAEYPQLERVGELSGLRGGNDSRVDLRLPAPEGVTLLPTPAVNDMGEGKTVDAWDEWTAKMQVAHSNGNGHGKSLSIEAQRLLPTPKASNNENRSSEWANGPNLLEATRLLPSPSAALGAGGQTSRSGERRCEPLLGGITAWGDYADAIARWERVLGRQAPAPTQTNTKGNPQLSPAFVEWLMGLPAGWVTDVPGITRSEALKAEGNGVVQQQAEAALWWFLEQIGRAAA